MHFSLNRMHKEDTTMTREQRREYYNELAKLCESLEGKTDNISNCLRANAVSTMTMLLKEGI